MGYLDWSYFRGVSLSVIKAAVSDALYGEACPIVTEPNGYVLVGVHTKTPKVEIIATDAALAANGSALTVRWQDGESWRPQ